MRVERQEVVGAARAPGPGAERAPGVVGARAPPRREADHAFAQTRAVVRLDGPGHEHRKAPAAAQYLLPPVGARRLRPGRTGEAEALGKAEFEDHGHAAANILGQVDAKVDRERRRIEPGQSGVAEIVASDDVHAADLPGLLRSEIPADRRCIGGHAAIDLAVERLHDLAAAPVPASAAGHRPARGVDEQRRQRVAADPCLVPVGGVRRVAVEAVRALADRADAEPA